MQIRSTGWDERKWSSSVLLARRPPAFHWRTLRESGGVEEGGAEEKPGARDGGGGGRGRRYIMGRWGIKGLETRVGRESSVSRGGLDCTVEVYMSEESEEGVTVIRQGSSSKIESCQEL